MKSITGILGLFACVALAITPMASAQASTAIKIATPQPDNQASTVLFRDVFKKYVEEKSNGELKVAIHANASLGNTNTVFQGLQFGTVDIMFDSTSNLALFAPDLSLCDLPYLFPDEASISRTLNSDEGKKLFSNIEKKNGVPMGSLASSFRYIISTSPISKLDDVQGMKLRTTSSPSHMAAINAIGMAATPMPASEMLTGLQQGVVKGMDVDVSSLYSYRFYEIAPNFYASEHIPVVYSVIASKKFLNKLSKDNREIVETGMKMFLDALTQKYAEDNARQLKELVEQKGCRLTVPSAEEKARWVEKSKIAYEKLDSATKAKAEALHKIAWGK